MNRSCIFCNPMEFSDRAIFESRFFIFALDRYQINSNHFLLISKRHTTSFGHLNCKELREAQIVIQNLQNNNAFVDKYVTAFERGNQFENNTVNLSIDHAHIHLFMLTRSLFDRFSAGEVVFNSSLLHLRNCIKLQSYFFYWEVMGSRWRIGNSNDLPSQYIRKFVSDEINRGSNWDWKQYPSFSDKKILRDNIKQILQKDSNFVDFNFTI